MKNNRVIAFILATLVMLCAMSTTAYAWQDKNAEYPTDPGGKYSTNLAPNACASVALGTKGVLNVPTSGTTAYKFWFTTTATGASASGIFKPAKLTKWSDTGTVRTAGESFTTGKGVTTAAYANYSSTLANSTTVNYCVQAR